MLAVALEAEVDDYLAAHAAERDEHGRRWWYATATRVNGRSPRPLGRSRSARHGSMTVARTR
jgi:hypothetical protein